jgi:hypothetical protein
MERRERSEAVKEKSCYIGAPAHFELEMACKQIRAAFAPPDDGYGDIFIVGSCTERPDFRDVDVRFILDDASFSALFPAVDVHSPALWEFDPRWTLLVVSITQWLRQQTGLPIDFQFHPMTWANQKHDGKRYAAGLTYVNAAKGGR